VKIPAPNFTQTPNVIFEYWMPLLNGAEFKVLCCLARKIFGWHKADYRDRISLSQIEKMTGLTRPSVTLAVKVLEKHNLIKRFVTGTIGQQQTVYEMVVEQESNSVYQLENFTPPQLENFTPPSKKTLPTKETTTKETTTKESTTLPSSAKVEPEPRARAATAGEKIFFKDPRGNATSIDESLIYRKMLDSGFPTEVVAEAIGILKESDDAIGNVFRFIEAICIRLVNSSKKPKNKKKLSEIRCQFKPSTGKMSTFEDVKKRREEEDERNRAARRQEEASKKEQG